MADPASAAAPSVAESIDAAIASFFASHNPITYLLVAVVTVFLVYPLFVPSDPDIHPFLLARQSQGAPIRNNGESPVYRALEVPHGYPLKASLGVKDPGAPKWTAGRQGDLRDILSRAVKGPAKDDGSGFDASKVGKVFTLLGKDKSVATEMSELARIVNAIGGFAKNKVQGNGQVAVCLSNSVELLAAVFAAAFYGLSVTLVPSGLPQELTDNLLSQIEVNVLIAEAGALDLDSALPKCKALKQVILVAKEHNKHMAWDDTPMPKGVEVATWHDIVDQSSATSELPTVEKDAPKPKPIGTFFLNRQGEMELSSLTSENIVSGITGLLATLPRTAPLSSIDTLLPTSSLTTPYTLSWTLAALYTNASLALTSVAGPRVDLLAALSSFRPTLVVTAPGTLQKYLHNWTHTGIGPSRITKFWQRRSLNQGIMPSRKPIPDLNGQQAVHLIVELQALQNVRGVFVGQDVNATDKEDKLSGKDLEELRVNLGLRIAYAATSGRVAGAVAQTNLMDYRDKKASVCVGPPLGSVEVCLKGDEEAMGGPTPSGKIVVKGPAVVGGKAELDVPARIDTDHTLILL